MSYELCPHDLEPLWCALCQEAARRKAQARTRELWYQALKETLEEALPLRNEDD